MSTVQVSKGNTDPQEDNLAALLEKKSREVYSLKRELGQTSFGLSMMPLKTLSISEIARKDNAAMYAALRANNL